MGDLRNKIRKEEDEARLKAARERAGPNGWTVFYFNFDPKLTRRDMDLGQAIRHLCKVTACKISFRRCPVRGLAINYKMLPRTSYSHDHGEQYMMMHFSDLADELEAKKVLVVDMLLRGVEHYRALPNRFFDEQVSLIRFLLTAPSSVGATEWMAARAKLQARTQEVLATHEPELRTHILGQKTNGKPHLCIVRQRLEAGER